ncbi:MAG: putative maltokinase, partial [Gemmatimonadota bacterium]
EDRFPIIDILQQTPAIPEGCQWATFLRNHDELTLEMVTDEDRDYMYRVYAHDTQARINLGIRRRLAPLMGNNRRRIELMNGLLFSLPGTPVVYYGDEIGMGDNIYLGDRNGVRTPMQWSADRNAGFSRANPQRLYFPLVIDPGYHYEAVNVAAQQNNTHSLLWWMKRIIALRKESRALGRGTIDFLHPENTRVLAFVRRHGDEQVLVVANLSRFAQSVSLDLRTLAGLEPVEMFGRTAFPCIGEQPYPLTLGPYSFYWFSLRTEHALAEADAPTLNVGSNWRELVREESRGDLEAALGAYLQRARWFRGKGRKLASVEISDIIAMDDVPGDPVLCMLCATYLSGEPETYAVPLACATGERARAMLAGDARALVAQLTIGKDESAILYDALWDDAVIRGFVDGVGRKRRWRGEHGEVFATRSRAFAAIAAGNGGGSTVLRGEQSNTSVLVADRLLMKVIRKLDAGVNPELEIGRFFTDKARFGGAPRLAGALEYRHGRDEPATLAVFHEFVRGSQDAWTYTLGELGRFFERVVATPGTGVGEVTDLPAGSLVAHARAEFPVTASELAGGYLERSLLLGERTAEMHLVLASAGDDPAFAPEGFTPHYRRGLYESLRTLTRTTFDLLSRRLKQLPEADRILAERVLGAEQSILGRARRLLDRRIAATRIRVHGDYHLGQVLYTGRDFVIVDFEGEPSRSLSERRFKRSPLRDVAGMLRSFDYAAAHALRHGPVRTGDAHALRRWGVYWSRWVSIAFLQGYLTRSGAAPFLPSGESLDSMLEFYLVEKAVYELRYELNNRPDWVPIPLEGIAALLGEAAVTS